MISNNIKFTDNKETPQNKKEIAGITCEPDKAGTVCQYTTIQEETKAGDIAHQTFAWNYGTDLMNIDYCFVIYYYKDISIEDVRKEDTERTYEEREVNGVTYIACLAEDGEPYVYYKQQGNDLYAIMNAENPSGYTQDESAKEIDEAFQTFLSTVKFTN